MASGPGPASSAYSSPGAGSSSSLGSPDGKRLRKRYLPTEKKCGRCGVLPCADLEPLVGVLCPVCSCLFCDAAGRAEDCDLGNPMNGHGDLATVLADSTRDGWGFWIPPTAVEQIPETFFEYFDEDMVIAMKDIELSDAEAAFLFLTENFEIMELGNSDIMIWPSESLTRLAAWAENYMDDKAQSTAIQAIFKNSLSNVKKLESDRKILAQADCSTPPRKRGRKAPASMDPEAQQAALQASHRLWNLTQSVRDFSGVYAEYAALTEDRDKLVFKEATIEKWSSTEARTLNGACSGWQRLRTWAIAAKVDVPKGITRERLIEYLKSKRADGPTAPQAQWNHLSYLARHAKFLLDVNSPLINVVPPDSHTAESAEPFPLTLQLFCERVAGGGDMSVSDPNAPGAPPTLRSKSHHRQYFSSVMCGPSVHGTRNAHQQRSVVVDDLLGPKTQVFYCSRGKAKVQNKRIGFHWVSMLTGVLGTELLPIIVETWKTRSKALGKPIPFLIFAPIPAGAQSLFEITGIGMTAMRSGQLNDIIRGTAKRLNLFHDDLVRKLTGHSGRHFNESTAMAALMDPLKQAALNQWASGTRNTPESGTISRSIATRYAAAKVKLALTAKTQKECVFLIRYLLAQLVWEIRYLNRAESERKAHPFEAKNTHEIVRKASWEELWAAAKQLQWEAIPEKMPLDVVSILGQIPEEPAIERNLAAFWEAPPDEPPADDGPAPFVFPDDTNDLEMTADDSDPREEDGDKGTESDSSGGEADPTSQWLVAKKGQTHLFSPPLEGDRAWIVARGLVCQRRIGANSAQGTLPTLPAPSRPWCPKCVLKAKSEFFRKPATPPEA